MAADMPGAGTFANEDNCVSLNTALHEVGSVGGDLGEKLPIAFRFSWHDMTIFCQVVERDGAVLLKLATDLGPLPFTIENPARRGFLKELQRSKIDLPHGEFVVTEQYRFRHCAARALTAPITCGGIVTSVVESLLSARPYYELAKAQL